MSKAFKFFVVRRAIVEEVYAVEADSEEEAMDRVHNGEIDYDNDLVSNEWQDWAEDEWTVTAKEDLCPLTKMVKEYDQSL